MVIEKTIMCAIPLSPDDDYVVAKPSTSNHKYGQRTSELLLLPLTIGITILGKLNFLPTYN